MTAGITKGWLTALGLGLTVGVMLPAWAAGASGVLEQEARLEKPLDIRAKEEPLAELLIRLGKAVGVPLEAAPDTANERVTVFSRGKSLRDVLMRIAEHLDYTWVSRRRNGKAHLVLIQDAAARQRELRLRGGPEREVAALRKLVEDRLELVESAATRVLEQKPEEWRVARIGELNERLFGQPVRGSDGVQIQVRPRSSPEERQVMERELTQLMHVTSGRHGRFTAPDAVGRLYGLLPRDKREALWQGERVRFAFPGEVGRVTIPPGTATALGETTIGTHGSRTDEDTGVTRWVPMKSLERMRAELSLERRGVEMRLRVRARVLGAIEDDTRTHRVERLFTEEWGTGRAWPQRVEGPLLDDRAAALRDPISIQPEKPMPGEEPSFRFADYLEKLAAAAPYPIIADGYAGGHVVATLESSDRTLASVAAQCCRYSHRTCRFEKGYLLFRHHDWATRRAMEPPSLRMRKWKADLTRNGTLPLSSLAEIAGLLTPEQRERLVMRWHGEVRDGILQMIQNEADQSGRMLRLLASLPAATRKLLDAGRTVEARTMPLGCQQLLRDILQESADLVGGTDGVSHLPQEAPYKAGSGFLEEDRQEAAWLMTKLIMRRTPTSWRIGTLDIFIETPLAEAMEVELSANPRAKESDIPEIRGDRVEVALLVPGARPVGHLFLDPRPAR